MSFQATYDPDVDAAYFKINDNVSVLDSEEIANGIIVDYDSDDNIVGIELLGVKTLNSQDFSLLNPLFSESVKNQFKEFFAKNHNALVIKLIGHNTSHYHEFNPTSSLFPPSVENKFKEFLAHLSIDDSSPQLVLA